MTTDDDLTRRLTRLEERVDRVLALLERPTNGNGHGTASAGAGGPLFALGGHGGSNGGGAVGLDGLVASAWAEAGQQRVAVHGEAELRAQLGETFLRLSDPEAIESLTRIVELAPRVEYAVQALAAAPALLEDGMEAARELAEKRGETTQELQARLVATGEILLGLTGPAPREAIARLGAVGPELLPIAEAAAGATRRLAEVEGREALTARLEETIVQLTEPGTLDSLTLLAQLAPRLELVAQAAAAAPALLEDAMALTQEALEKRGERVDFQARVEAGGEALLTLSRPETLDALGRVASLAPELGRLAEALGKATSARAEVEGADALQARLDEAVLALTDPDTLASLVRVAELTPRLEYAVQAAAAAPALLEDALAVVREHVSDDRERIEAGIELLKTVTHPVALRGFTNLTAALPDLTAEDTARALEGLSRQATKVAPLLARLTDAQNEVDLEGLADMLVRVGKPEIQSALARLMEIAPRLVPVLEALPIQPHTLGVLTSLNEAIEAAAAQPSRVGAWGLLRTLSDPDVQRAVGFGREVARRLGGSLAQPDKQLPPSS